MIKYKKNKNSFIFKGGLIFILYPLFYDNVLYAQFNETIRTGRPGQSIGAYAVGKNVFQLQTGVDFGKSNGPTLNAKRNSTNAVFRYGLTKTFELNSAFEYRSDKFRTDTNKFTNSVLSNAAVGMRYNILEGMNKQPAIGFQLTFQLPIIAKVYNLQQKAPKFLVIVSENISNKVELTANVGGSLNGNDAVPTGIYVLNLSYSINKKWGTFIENYGNLKNNVYHNRWDAGIAYLATNNLQLDIYGGAGLNSGNSDYFFSVGISYRVLTKNQTTKKLN